MHCAEQLCSPALPVTPQAPPGASSVVPRPPKPGSKSGLRCKAAAHPGSVRLPWGSVWRHESHDDAWFTARAVCIPRYPPYLGARGTFSECTSGTAAFRICPGNSGYLGMGARSAHAVWDARGSCARARACSGRVRMTGCALVRSARRRTPRQAPQPRRLHYVPEVYLGNQACDQRARRRRRTVRFL